VTLRSRVRQSAPGLPPPAVWEKFAAIQMVDVHLPTTDGCEIVLTRYTQPEPDVDLLLKQRKLQLPAQAQPRLDAKQELIPQQAM